jgi:hypothetical protein
MTVAEYREITYFNRKNEITVVSLLVSEVISLSNLHHHYVLQAKSLSRRVPRDRTRNFSHVHSQHLQFFLLHNFVFTCLRVFFMYFEKKAPLHLVNFFSLQLMTLAFSVSMRATEQDWNPTSRVTSRSWGYRRGILHTGQDF